MINQIELAQINEDTPLQEISDPFLKERGITLSVKREDLVHPQITGNKWYKLKYNLKEALTQGRTTILTFGGAFSNHIYSVAAAGKIFGFNTIGIIRGERHFPLNPTLSFATDNGMHIQYLDRNSYRRKDSYDIIEKFSKEFGDFYLLPEGGTNEFAVRGCSEIINKLKTDFDYVCCPCGTGGTLAGLISGLNEKKFALGFAVLRSASFLRSEVSVLLKKYSGRIYKNWEINLDYHFGGYAKMGPSLIKFIKKFMELTNIPIEPIYTGKMFFGIYDLIEKGRITEGSKIIAVHTGGLQGLKGLLDRRIIADINDGLI